MKRLLAVLSFVSCQLSFSVAQTLLTLDSCRAMALRNNKQMRVAEVRRDVAANVRRAARTKYLPHVSAVGGYEHTSREITLLSDAQKSALGNLGTGLAGELQGGIAGYAQVLPTALQQQIGADLSQMAGALNDKGQHLVDALRTDTRNIWAGSILLTQPLYMGGAIVAANKMADLSEQMVENAAETRRQATLYSVDQAYWQVVSLSHKQRLAESYLELVRKLETDVGKMMTDGVATRSDALSVSVKVNEAEMALTKVTDGLTLSKMLLCQICGLPVSESEKLIVKSEEFATAQGGETSSAAANSSFFTLHSSFENRPELRMLWFRVVEGHQVPMVLVTERMDDDLSADLKRLDIHVAQSSQLDIIGLISAYPSFLNEGLSIEIPFGDATVYKRKDGRYAVRASLDKRMLPAMTIPTAMARFFLELQDGIVKEACLKAILMCAYYHRDVHYKDLIEYADGLSSYC